MKVKIQNILKEELDKKKLTINKIANECNIPVSVLHGWVNGTLPSAKNLHLVKVLSDYLNISIPHLLFAEKNNNDHLILFSSTFRDGETQYKLTIEKVKNNESF